MEQSALFIEELVYILIQLNDNFDDSEAKILKETLHTALPHIKCNFCYIYICIFK